MYAVHRQKPPRIGNVHVPGGGKALEGREAPEPVPEYTVVGVLNDGVELNQAVKEVRDLGVDRDDLTVILKREDMSEPEPFPEDTRYIVVPADKRGLEVPLGFAVSFIVFLSLAGILFVGSLTRVGVSPILTEMEAPPEEAGTWNDQFEMGKVLVFASTRERRLLRPVREALQRGGAMYYIVDQRLEPRAVHQATLHRVGGRQAGESVVDRTGS